jgi:hypothetical protein
MEAINLEDDEDTQPRCEDCACTANDGRGAVRNDWELTEPAMLCSCCNTERLCGARVPQEWLIERD